MRTKPFVATFSVARYLSEHTDVDDLAHKAIASQLTECRGPRGGRYIPVDEIRYDKAESFSYFDVITYRGRRTMRYVRPSR